MAALAVQGQGSQTVPTAGRNQHPFARSAFLDSVSAASIYLPGKYLDQSATSFRFVKR